MKLHKRLCCLLLVLACLCSPILAARTSGLTIHYKEGGMPLVGAPFSLYRVAWEGENGQLIIAEEFSKYHVNITADESKWPALASTLAAYASFGRITPIMQGRTDSEGVLHFADLPQGLYLVVGDLHRQNGLAYTAEPALVAYRGEHMDIFPKAEWVPDGGGDGWDEETIKVLKIWEDGEGTHRPKTITVHLLQDGKIYDTVILSEENRWRATWQELPAGHSYSVVEENVEGYTVSIRRQGITFVLTNTADDLPPPDVPSDRPEEIPKTGQPWAYVLLLTAAGLLLLIIGLYIRRGEKHEA